MSPHAQQNTERIKTVCFTGHRDIGHKALSNISQALRYTLRSLIYAGVDRFLAGGALGFDTLAAICVLDLKKEFPHIRLELILPCKNQTKLWSASDRVIYNEILSAADRVEYLHESYTSSCMHDRNRRLVDEGDICVAFLEHSGGGTAYTAAYAMKKGKEIINIAEMI